MSSAEGRFPTVTGFLSPGPNAGRSAAVTNSAWLLASAGHRVLVVELDQGEQFSAGALRHYQVSEDLGLVSVPAPLGEDLRRWSRDVHGSGAYDLSWRLRSARFTQYRLPDGESHLDVLVLPGVLAGLADQRFADSLRAVLHGSGYTHTLVDFPADLSPERARLAGSLVGTAFVCVEPLDAQVSPAAELRTALGTGGRPAGTISALITDVPEVPSPAVDRVISELWQVFAPSGSGGSGAAEGARPVTSASAVITVPRYPGDDRLGLAVLLEPEPPRSIDLTDGASRAPRWTAGERPTPVTEAYLTVARTIHGEAFPAPPPLSAGARYRYEKALGKVGPSPSPSPVVVVHQPIDRPWAEWAQHWLERNGTQVHRITSARDLSCLPEVGTVITIEEPDRDIDLAAATPSRLRTLDRIQLRIKPAPVAQLPTPEPLSSEPGQEAIDLRGLTSQDAGQVLLRRLGILGPAAGSGDGRDLPLPRSPQEGRSQVRTGLPRRNHRFVGRGREFEALRDTFTAPAGPRALWMWGPPGVGKSELVREYLYRFGYDYDLAWWVSAHDLQAAREDLEHLARDRKVETGGDIVQAVLTELATTTHRWLLVCDDVRDTAVLEEILPRGGPGQVVVTSDTPPPAGWASETFELGLFDDADARDLLAMRVDCLRDEDAALVLDAAGTHPAVVNLAARWLDATATTMQRAGHAGSRVEATAWAVAELRIQHVLRVQESTIDDPERRRRQAMVEVVLETLSTTRQGRLILLLARFLSMLSSTGADIALLCSAPVVDRFAAVAGEDGVPLLDDTVEMHHLLRLGVSNGLFDLGWQHGVRLRGPALLAETLDRFLPGRPREVMRQRLLRALADAAPTDAEGDDPAQHPRYRELGRHLRCCGAMESADPQVRRWVVNQVRHWYRTGDVGTHRKVLGLAERIFQEWTERFGAEDRMRLRLGTQLANLHRSLGDDHAALAIDEPVLAVQRRVLGLDNPRTLMTARGRASDLLGFGRFEEAVREEHTAWLGFQDLYGDNHLETVMAAHDLSLCLSLAGQTQEALRIGTQTLARVRRLYGAADPMIIRVAVQVSHALREIGRQNSANRQLTQAREWLRQATRVGQREELLLLNNLQILKRDLGGWPGALDDHQRVLQRYREVLGVDHPESLAAWLSVTGHLFRTGGPGQAVAESTRCLGRFVAVYGSDHPFTAVCRSSHGLLLRSTDPEAAASAGRIAVRDLDDRLTPTHPWALFGRLTLAGHLAAIGDDEGAAVLETEVRSRGRELLPVRHPVVLIAERNLARSRAGDGTGSGGREDFLVEIPQT